MPYIPETRVIGLHFCRCMYGSIFIQICAVGLQKTHLFSTREHQSAFWPFKVIQGRWFWYQSKARMDFLLVGHSNYGSIVHRFWDTAIYWLKIAYFSNPTLIRGLWSLCSLWNFAVKLTMRKLESWDCWLLSSSEDPMIVAWVVLTQCQHVTDRRTDLL